GRVVCRPHGRRREPHLWHFRARDRPAVVVLAGLSASRRRRGGERRSEPAPLAESALRRPRARGPLRLGTLRRGGARRPAGADLRQLRRYRAAVMLAPRWPATGTRTASRPRRRASTTRPTARLTRAPRSARSRHR